MRIEALRTNVNSNYNNSNKNNNVAFEGLGLTRVTSSKKRAYEKYISSIAGKYGAFMGLDIDSAYKMLVNQSERRLAFFRTIADRYNGQNFYQSVNNKEANTHALEIFNDIKRPKIEHFFVLHHVKGTFEHISEILHLADNEKKLRFIQEFYDEYRGFPNKESMIRDIFAAPNCEQLMSDYKGYKSYLRLYSEDKNVMKNLSKLITEGKYKQSDYDIKYTMHILSNCKKIASGNIVTEDALKESYTPEGLHILRKTVYDYINTREHLTDDNLRELLNIYKTTNKYNVEFRDRVLNNFRNSADLIGDNAIDGKEISALRELLDAADKDNMTRLFIEKALKYNLDVKTVQELRDILKVVNPQKANIFYDNLSRIIRSTHNEERYYALTEHLEDPFYVNRLVARRYKTQGHKPFSGESMMSKAVRFVENKINMIKYGKVKNSTEALEPAEMPPTMRPLNIVIKRESIYAQRLDSVPIPKEKSLAIIPPTEHILAKALAEITSRVKKQEEMEVARKLELSNTLKSARKAKKLQVISDINGIISKKLGKKTLDEQGAIYEKKATKIRLSLLPDIFESIKTTRKAQREANIKPNISSKDALELYKRINGHNRKLVRYMLSKRYDGSDKQIFTVREIIKFLDNAENIIAENKMVDKAYKPKTYYDTILDQCVSCFGKLPTKKVKTTKTTKVK